MMNRPPLQEAAQFKISERQRQRDFALAHSDTSFPAHKMGRWNAFRGWLIRIGVLRPPSEQTPLSNEQQEARRTLLFHSLRSPRFPQ